MPKPKKKSSKSSKPVKVKLLVGRDLEGKHHVFYGFDTPRWDRQMGFDLNTVWGGHVMFVKSFWFDGYETIFPNMKRLRPGQGPIEVEVSLRVIKK